MRLRTSEDIQRVALGRGAEVEIAGRAFNASQQRAAPKPKAAEAAPAPAAPTLTHEDVVRIAAQMLAESERRTAAAIAEQAQAMTLAIAKALREAAPAAAPGRVLLRQKIKVAYDDEDRITEMTVTPVYKE